MPARPTLNLRLPEQASGLLLLVATALALVWANLGPSYEHVLGAVRPLVDDGLMTIFFLGVGLEIRKEIAVGVLSDARRAALPLFAAAGGMLVPALVFASLNRGPDAHGWGIPTAPDIAFALAVVTAMRAPPALRALLLALAVLDDVGAILVIAFAYAGHVDLVGLLVALGGIALVYALRRARGLHVLAGVLVWYGLHRAGIHPTLAGVIVGLLTPVAMGARIESALRPWTAFGIMPLFALTNAGVALGGLRVDMITAGAALGLAVGKPIGVLSASWLAVRLGIARRPDGLGWRGIAWMGLAAGVGFTMAIFIAGLAFPSGSALASAKVGVLVGSLLSALAALGVGRLAARRRST